MSHDMRQHGRCIRIVYGIGLALLMFALSWLGLRYLVSHATGSLEAHLVADIVVPLAQSPDRTAYAHTLVRQSLAGHVGSTLVDTRCLQMHGSHRACATGVRNTIDEALHLRRVFEEEHVARAIIVTSPEHLARAAAVFSIIFAGSGLEVHVVATPDEHPSAKVLTREVTSYLPSLAAAVLARFVPAAYEWSVGSFRGSGQPYDASRPSA